MMFLIKFLKSTEEIHDHSTSQFQLSVGWVLRIPIALPLSSRIQV